MTVKTLHVPFTEEEWKLVKKLKHENETWKEALLRMARKEGQKK